MQEINAERIFYVPLVSIKQITAAQKLGRIPIAAAIKPNCPCGLAKRIGYTGPRLADLAIYRLKVHGKDGVHLKTLPMLFVVDNGIFVEYEQWRKRQRA